MVEEKKENNKRIVEGKKGEGKSDKERGMSHKDGTIGNSPEHLLLSD